MTKFKKGDKVFDWRHGKGVVREAGEGKYSLLEARFSSEDVTRGYCLDGRECPEDKYPALMLIEEAKELGLYKEPVNIEVKVKWVKVTLESGDDMIVPIQLWDDRHGKLLFGDFTGKTGTLTFVEDEK